MKLFLGIYGFAIGLMLIFAPILYDPISLYFGREIVGVSISIWGIRCQLFGGLIMLIGNWCDRSLR